MRKVNEEITTAQRHAQMGVRAAVADIEGQLEEAGRDYEKGLSEMTERHPRMKEFRCRIDVLKCRLRLLQPFVQTR